MFFAFSEPFAAKTSRPPKLQSPRSESNQYSVSSIQRPVADAQERIPPEDGTRLSATADELLAANAEALGHVKAAAAKCGFFNPDWRESALENGGRELGLDFRALRELLVLLRLKARRCREDGDIDGALAVVDDMSAIAVRLRDNARTNMEWLFGIAFQESADRACGALVRSELLTREKLALLRRAVFERIGRWQGSVDRILVAETAIVLGGLDNWTAADFRKSEAFLPFGDFTEHAAALDYAIAVLPHILQFLHAVRYGRRINHQRIIHPGRNIVYVVFIVDGDAFLFQLAG